MPEIKYKLLNFRVEEAHLDRIDRLAKRMKVTRSQAIRLSLDEAIGKYIEPGYKGEFQVLNTEFLNTILTNLGNRIFELENPKGHLGSRIRESAEAARRVRKLHGQGKDKEAEKLLRKREKEGKYTSSGFSWVDDKQ